MGSKARSVVAVVGAMAAAGTTMHLLGTFLRLSPIPKSAIMLLGTGLATVLALYLASRGADSD
jgi:hypothetical protein